MLNANKSDSFYKAWTAMESYFKYKGKGFYTDKKFVMDLKKRMIKDSSGNVYIYFKEVWDYTMCICADRVDVFENLKFYFYN